MLESMPRNRFLAFWLPTQALLHTAENITVYVPRARRWARTAPASFLSCPSRQIRPPFLNVTTS